MFDQVDDLIFVANFSCTPYSIIEEKLADLGQDFFALEQTAGGARRGGGPVWLWVGGGRKNIFVQYYCDRNTVLQYSSCSLFNSQKSVKTYFTYHTIPVNIALNILCIDQGVLTGLFAISGYSGKASGGISGEF